MAWPFIKNYTYPTPGSIIIILPDFSFSLSTDFQKIGFPIEMLDTSHIDAFQRVKEGRGTETDLNFLNRTIKHLLAFEKEMDVLTVTAAPYQIDPLITQITARLVPEKDIFDFIKAYLEYIKSDFNTTHIIFRCNEDEKGPILEKFAQRGYPISGNQVQKG